MSQTQTILLYQPLLHRIAYQLLKCKSDAEDVVQDTFARWLSLDTKAISNKKAYLVKMVTNNCLNHLESLKKKKQAYLDSVHLPEFVQHIREFDLSPIDISTELRSALTQLQAKLQPLERAVFVLREALDLDYDEIQVILEKKKDHLRQLLSRAKKKLASEPAAAPTGARAPHLEDAFRKAVRKGEASDFIAELRKDLP